MKNILFLSTVLGIAFLFFSCDNDDSIVSNESLKVDTQLKSEVVKMQSVAKILVGMVNQAEILNEVKAGVSASLSHGRDENLMFKTVLYPKGGESLRSSNGIFAKQFSNALRNYQSQGLRSSGSGSELETFILENGVEIYWPYSENWDGKETPVVTFDPMTGNADKVYAYKNVELSNGESSIDSLIVDEEYAKVHPVWVVNQNEIYNEYMVTDPAWELIDDDSFVPELPAPENPAPSPNGQVSVFKLGTLRVTTQHDDWLNGGSEFEFRCSMPLGPSYTTSGLTVQRICISRGDISNGKTFTINKPLNTNWTVEQLHNALKVVETDNGGTKYWAFKLGVNLGSLGNWGIDANIPYGSNDDFIFEQVLDRNYVLSSQVTNGSNPVVQSYDGVHWTMFIENVN